MVDFEKVRYPRLHRHTHTNTNTVVALAQAGNGDQTGLAVGAGLASWGKANFFSPSNLKQNCLKTCNLRLPEL